MRERYIDIDVAIGICITLVVFGHLELEPFKDFKWYISIRSIIYKFHMPVFMFFSGCIIALSMRSNFQWNWYIHFLAKKGRKFFLPFIIISLIFLFVERGIKLNSWDDYLFEIKLMLFYSPKSAAGFLWYIYVLFFYYAIIPLIFKFIKSDFLILIGAIGVHFLPVFTELFSLNLFNYYLIFVILGFLSFNYNIKYRRYLHKLGIYFLILFLLLILAQLYIDIPKSVFGLIAIPAIHFIALNLKNILGSIFKLLGKSSFDIYLFNTMVIGGLYIVGFNYLDFKPSISLLLFFFICGLLAPIILLKIIRKNPLLKKIFI
jgi:fucose 4-O-acetylase-like acetyltransferase